MTAKELMKIIEQDIVDLKYRAKSNPEYIQSVVNGHKDFAIFLFDHIDNFYHISTRFPTEQEKKDNTYSITFTTTDYDVALNKLYNIDVETDKEYTIEVKPIAMIDLDNPIAIYDNDPGQCWFMRYKDEIFSSSAYSKCPEAEILDQYICKLYKEVEELCIK